MQYEKYFTDLLKSTKQASLPGLGRFKVVENPSRLVEGKMLPPSKFVQFESNLIEQGTEFVDYVAEHEKISANDSLQLISKDVAEILDNLKKGNPVQIKGIGSLSLKDGEIALKSLPDHELFEGSIQMPEVEPLKEIKKQTSSEDDLSKTSNIAPKISETIPSSMKSPVPPPQPAKPSATAKVPDPVKTTSASKTEVIGKKSSVSSTPKARNSRNNKKLLLYASVAAFALALIYIVYLFELWKPIQGLIAGKSKNLPAVETPILQDSLGIDSLNTKENALGIEEEKQPLTYYIIAGSFRKKENADRYSSEMSESGFTTYTLNYNDTLFRVAIYASQNRQEAVDKFIELQEEKGMTIWFMSI